MIDARYAVGDLLPSRAAGTRLGDRFFSYGASDASVDLLSVEGACARDD
jgi:hypothetical protein